MKIDVKHVAKLANLQLTTEEEKKYSEQLSKILDYFEKLNQADTSKVKPTFNVTSNVNVLRKDETVASLAQEESLSNAGSKKDGMFVTKGVFDE